MQQERGRYPRGWGQKKKKRNLIELLSIFSDSFSVLFCSLWASFTAGDKLPTFLTSGAPPISTPPLPHSPPWFSLIEPHSLSQLCTFCLLCDRSAAQWCSRSKPVDDKRGGGGEKLQLQKQQTLTSSSTVQSVTGERGRCSCCLFRT